MAIISLCRLMGDPMSSECRGRLQRHSRGAQAPRVMQPTSLSLGVIDTGALLASPKALPLRADGRFMEVGLSQAFLEYGLWQDYGTGRETPRGNSGDLGRAKKRQRRRWFSRKYYASVMNLKEFYEENIGREFCGILSSALSKDFRQNH